MRSAAIFLGLWLALIAAWQLSAQTPRMTLMGVGGTPAASCTQATNFNARTSGQDAAHKTANTTFICNLVTEGVWSKLDVVYLFATDTSANALLNLVSSSFNGTANGAPTFAANAGFTGADGSTTKFIDTGFNPSTAGGNYTQNSAHASTWGGTNVQATTGGATIGNWNLAGTVLLDIAPRNSSNQAGIYINSGTVLNVSNATSLGHYLANRTSSTAIASYKNGSSIGTDSANTSAALINANIYVLAVNETTVGATAGAGQQIMTATIGSSLTAGDITNLCHETNTYLNTIAGVASGTC